MEGMRMEKIIAYKAFNRDMTCRGMRYKKDVVYEIKGEPILCERGFHFCKDIVLTLDYYPVINITDNRYAKVEILGEVKYEDPTKHKGVTNKIKIIKVFTNKEIKKIINKNRNSGDGNSGRSNSGDRNPGDWNSGYSNSGDRNSGNRNTGYSNSGDRNSGYWNSGDWNSGDWNSGYRNTGYSNSGYSNSGDRNSGYWNSGSWNSCDRETGYLNSESSNYINVFNKKCSLKKWDNAYKPDFMFFIKTDGETYKEAFVRSWENADKSDRERVRDLPNFDKKVFFKISGIKLK